VSRDPDRVFREFLPSKTLTVHPNGVHINYRHYWHDVLRNRIGQKLEIGRDERTIQHVYAEIDGEHIELTVKGYYPDVSEAEWEAERARVRQLGKAYQGNGARAATARAIESAHKEIVNARAKTKEARKTAKRREREGLTLTDLRREQKPAPPPLPDWKAVSDLGDDEWLKVLA
jgi:putative transposase